MAKYSVAFGSSKVVLTDKLGKTWEGTFEASMSLGDAVQATKVEQAKRGDVARAHLTILCAVLDTPRTDAYKGKCPIGDKLSTEFKSAVRSAEEATLQGDFVAALIAKGNTHPQALAMFDSYIKDLRDGMYARYKATASIYYAYFGLLPCVYEGGNPDKSRLLSVTTMEKLIANAKTDLEQEDNQGFSLAIAKLAHDVRSRTEKSHIGDIQRAIDNLTEMLATFNGLKNDAAIEATASHTNIIATVVETQAATKTHNKRTIAKGVASDADKLINKAKAIVKADATALV